LRIGVIDIGASTTCLLVADVGGAGGPRQVLLRRHSLTPARTDTERLTALVNAEADHARRGGANHLIVSGRASLRGTHHARLLDRLCKRLDAGSLRILGARDKAELAFAGATATSAPDRRLAVVTIGLSSTEIAVGHPRGGPAWRGSRPAGVWRLSERARFQDPPSAAQISAARSAASRSLSNLHPPRADAAVLADGGAAMALRRLCGDRIDAAALERASRRLFSTPGAALAEELGLAVDQVRPLPAAVAIAAAACELAGHPLETARGGIREGLIVERERELAAGGILA